MFTLSRKFFQPRRFFQPLSPTHLKKEFFSNVAKNKVAKTKTSFKGVYFHGSPEKFKPDGRFVYIHQNPKVGLAYAQKYGGSGVLYKVTPVAPSLIERNSFGHLRVIQSEWKFEEIKESDIAKLLKDYEKKEFDSTNLLTFVPIGIFCVVGLFAEAVRNNM